MNKNLLSLALGGLMSFSAVSAIGFRDNLRRVGSHAHDNRAAYGLIALTAFGKFAKDDIKKNVSPNSVLSVGDKIVELAPLFYALALGNLASNDLTKSVKGFINPMGIELKPGKDRLETFLGNGLSVFSTLGAAYAVGKYAHKRFTANA